MKYFVYGLALRIFRRSWSYYYYTALFRMVDSRKSRTRLLKYVNKNLAAIGWRTCLTLKSDWRELRVDKTDVLTKDKLRYLLKEKNVINPLLKSNTSGTSGKPLTMYFRWRDIQKSYAIWDHYLWLNGISRNSKRARFSGRLGKDDSYFITMHPLHLRLYNSYRLEHDDVKCIVGSLLRWKMELIEGYPSTIATIAKWILKNDKDIVFEKLKMISVTAETLFEVDRHCIEKAFKVKVFNQYASSEGSPFIYECNQGNLHLMLYSGLLHRINGMDNFVVSSFRSSRIKLRAYDIGDTFDINERDLLFKSSCKCNSIHPSILSVGGRTDDYVYDENNVAIQRLDIAYKGLTGIVESQVVQNEHGTLEVFVVPDTDWIGLNESILKKNFTKLLGDGMVIKIKLVTKINRGPNGKFRSVINNIK
jgi:phenylacetate-CoA ligase